MTSTSSLSVAVAGTGFMGPAHTEALRRLGLPVVGILGSNLEKSQVAARQLGIPRAYASFEDLLADDSVGAVHITTPNRLHYAMAKAALERGKHVLCEKPLAMNTAESAELVKLARASGRVAAVNYNVRFYPLCLESRDRVRRGDVGPVHAVSGSYVQDWLLFDTDYNWRVLAAEGGNVRAIGDIGTHWLDLIQFITGLEVEAVLADLHTVHSVRKRPKGEVETFKGKTEAPQASEPIEIATEDCGSVLIRFKGGARGTLWVSQMTAGRKNRAQFEIAGARSALAWDSEVPNELWIGHRDRANELLLKDPGLTGETARHFTGYPGGHDEGYPDSFKQCFKAFYEAIEAGDVAASPTLARFDEGHREIEICEAIFRSHQEGGRWITV